MKPLFVSLLFASACTGQGVFTSPSLGSGTGSDSGSDVGNGYEQCSLPEGPLHDYTQVSEFNTLVVGTWWHCSGPKILSNEQAGIEFDADGKYYLIADDGSGNPVKLTGFGNQGTWDGSQEGETVQFNIHPTSNSGLGGYPMFEDGPRRFAMEVEYNDDMSIYTVVQ
ncbi:MAG: hypothetical protein QM831_11540 [Kofleriaceae bacterium]